MKKGIFGGLGSEMSEAFFDSMLRDHKLLPAAGKAIKSGWSNSNWKGKTAMLGAGALALPPAIQAAEKAGDRMRESPVGTVAILGGAAVGLKFGHSAITKSANKWALQKKAGMNMVEEYNTSLPVVNQYLKSQGGKELSKASSVHDIIDVAVKAGDKQGHEARHAYAKAKILVRNDHFGGRKGYKAMMESKPSTEGYIKAAGAAVGGTLGYSAASRLWND